MSQLNEKVISNVSLRSTLNDIFKGYVKLNPNKIAYRFLENGEQETDARAYQELYNRATIIATHILTKVKVGDRVLLLYPSGLDFIDAFLGCLIAGVIAVPGYPPTGKRRLSRIEKIANDCDASMILCTEDVYIKCHKWFDSDTFEKIIWCPTNSLASIITKKRFSKINSDSIVFLQYTSGSRGDPKGIMVSHKNLMDNSKLFKEICGQEVDYVKFSWLPIYHDMGFNR